MLFFYEITINIYFINLSNIVVFIHYFLLLIVLKLNFFFINYINFSNFNFDASINYFYNSIDYNFYIYYKLIILISNNNFYTVNFNVKNFKTFNILSNYYLDDYIINKLLNNKLQYIHPLLFFIIVNFKLYQFDIYELNKYISLIIIFFLFVFLGLYWSNQNPFWNSWWIWDISELYIVFIVIYLLCFFHIKIKNTSCFFTVPLFLYLENLVNLLYDLFSGFYFKSHEFVLTNSFKFLTYWFLYLLTINDFKSVFKLSKKLKIKNINLIFQISIILIIYNSILKHFIVFYYWINCNFIFIIVFCFSFFLLFSNKIIFDNHFYIIYLIIYFKLRIISNINVYNLITNSLNSFQLNYENYSILFYNFKFFVPINNLNDKQILNINFFNSNIIYKFNNFFNNININKSGESIFFFLLFCIINLYLQKSFNNKFL